MAAPTRFETAQMTLEKLEVDLHRGRDGWWRLGCIWLRGEVAWETLCDKLDRNWIVLPLFTGSGVYRWSRRFVLVGGGLKVGAERVQRWKWKERGEHRERKSVVERVFFCKNEFRFQIPKFIVFGKNSKIFSFDIFESYLLKSNSVL